MRRAAWLAALLATAPAGAASPSPAVAAASATPAPRLPETPAGQVLRAWLTAFNSDDLVQQKAYAARFDAHEDVERMNGFRHMTGGFELVAIERSDRLHLDVSLHEVASGRPALLRLEVSDAKVPQVEHITIKLVPPGMKPAQLVVRVDAATRKRVIDKAAALIERYYIDLDVGRKMTAALRAHAQKGDYDRIDDGDAFADQLTNDLRAISHDGHLWVATSERALPADEDPFADPPLAAEDRAQMERDNCGVVKAEHLPGNIGYLKLDFVMPPEACAETLQAAFGLVAHSDALVLDLRDNRGGAPSMVALVMSYLLPQRTHINDLYTRATGVTEQYWTQATVPGLRLTKQPVFALTSRHTFSGGEELSYDLQTQKRATLVGEATGGGAHPTAPMRLDAHFQMGVPFARPINPVTKRDWEGSGVLPDVKVPADQALDKALELAQKKLRKP